MKKGELERAKRRALNILDAWLDTTGAISEGSSWRYELEGVVEDSVHCGAQAALGVYKKLDSEPSEAQKEGRLSR